MSETKATDRGKKKDRTLVYVALALIVIIVLSCLSIVFINIQGSVFDSDNITDIETEQITRQSYVPITSGELSDRIASNEAFFVYVGRTTCPYCAQFSPLLEEVISETNTLVYYYDTAEARTDDPDKLTAILEQLNVTSVPALLLVENGEVVSKLADYTSHNAIIEFLIR